MFLSERRLCLEVEEVKGELMERYKVLPALSTRLSDLESQTDELRERNRQMEQKLAAMQVRREAPPTRRMYSSLRENVGVKEIVGLV